MAVVDNVAARLRAEQEEYLQGEDVPLGGYSAAIATYIAVVTAVAVALRRCGRPLPERVPGADLVLVTVATHKLSRLVSKDAVTAPLRAPFTRFKGAAGNAELHEEVRGHGIRRVIGDLLTCPFCLDMWIATFFVMALVAFPRATRLAASVLTALTGADALQFAYVALKDAGK